MLEQVIPGLILFLLTYVTGMVTKINGRIVKLEIADAKTETWREAVDRRLTKHSTEIKSLRHDHDTSVHVHPAE